MKGLLVYLKDYKKESILGPLFKLLEASFELIVPLVVASMIQLLTEQLCHPLLIMMVAPCQMILASILIFLLVVLSLKVLFTQRVVILVVNLMPLLVLLKARLLLMMAISEAGQ